MLLCFIIIIGFSQQLYAQPNPFAYSRYSQIEENNGPRLLGNKFEQYSNRHALLIFTGSKPQIYSIIAPDTLMLPESGLYNFVIQAIVSDPDSTADVDSVWFFSRNSSNPDYPFYLSNSGNSIWFIDLQINSQNRLDTYPFVFFAKDYEGNLSDSVVHNITLVAYPSSIESQVSSNLSTIALSQNFPNPFNTSTSISFSLPTRSFVSLKVFDILGREVAILAFEDLLGGFYTRQWNATNMPSSVYFYRLQANSFTETKKLILSK